MEIFAKLILMITGNLTALLITAYFEPNFVVSTHLPDLISLVFTLSMANLVIRPLLRLLFNPLIGLTLGFFHIVISGMLLYGIDIYSASLTINGLWALVLGAHAVGLITALIDYSAAMIYGGGEI